MLITFSTGTPGLTPGYTILNADKSQFQARVTAGITDLGGGEYGADVAEATLSSRVVLWDTGEVVPRYAAETFTDLSIIPNLGALAVTVTSPVAASGTITVEQGDSYRASRGRPIDVNVDDPTHARELDAANVTLYLLATKFTWTASSVTETTPGYLVRFEPTIAETAAVLRGQSYKLKACIDQVEPTDDDAETIQRGWVVLNRDIPAVGAEA